MIKLFLIAISFITFIDFPVFASENLESDLDSVQRQLQRHQSQEKQAKKKALSTAEDVYKIRSSLISAASKIQSAEEQVSSLEKKFRELKKEEEKALAQIKEKQVHISRLLGILQAMSLRPTEAMIIQESDPVDALRSSLLVRDTIPLITRETDKLKKNLSELSAIRENIRQQYLKIKQASSKLKDERQQITVLLNKKVKLQKNFETQAKKSETAAKKLEARAKNLQELIFELELQKSKDMYNFGVESFDFAGMKGKILLPVKGRIAKKYGETLQSGIVSKGISINGIKGAQVIAPFDGTVVFSGPFRDYRDVLIIDHGKGYHTLLAGMAKNDTIVGQGLLAGEPVGTLPLAESNLYIEIRQKGNAVNPKGWFIN